MLEHYGERRRGQDRAQASRLVHQGPARLGRVPQQGQLHRRSRRRCWANSSASTSRSCGAGPRERRPADRRARRAARRSPACRFAVLLLDARPARSPQANPAAEQLLGRSAAPAGRPQAARRASTFDEPRIAERLARRRGAADRARAAGAWSTGAALASVNLTVSPLADAAGLARGDAVRQRGAGRAPRRRSSRRRRRCAARRSSRTRSRTRWRRIRGAAQLLARKLDDERPRADRR